MSAAQPEVPAGRIAQMRQAFTMTRRTDRALPLYMLLAFLVVGGLFVGLSLWIFGTGVLGIIMSVVLALFGGTLGALIIFGKRAEKAAYAQVEGQIGAGASVLTMLRRGWVTKPAVAFNRQQDVVHRVVGRPGVILVGEGSPGGVRQLLSSERKKHARIVGADVPIHEVVVGRGEGQVPVTKLVKHVRKMKKAIKPAQVTEVVSRTKALDAMRPPAPMPRGPVPTSMRGHRKAMRG
ncbi:DUF4191 domain-containing protein [Aeromicrobium sp. IC_218]|uniref:DUF4191 domain-containing protein n=1 Tax=Aeromicrobium sp. IC_218 TaxID=2545468 RepID=UPI00103E3218|nr:DUF4191 domain-containing protein [Aeromicrobium sp. IC_218]TCI99700.1 DUF4191 domain-containing protein [Aeromicrobium sp. IC_218]